MSRLYRNTRTEALTDVIVSAERVAEIEKQYEGVHLPSYNAFSAEDKNKNKHDIFIIFRGQAVYHAEFGDGVVVSEDGPHVQVRFKEDEVWLDRKYLGRITYPKPQAIKQLIKDENLGHCPKCGTVKLSTTVDADGDIHVSCQGRACSYVQVWKGNAVGELRKAA
jgi:hypothetical protein